jgi:Zinc carboxypeptidase/Immune inhibitor A peptidase M6
VKTYLMAVAGVAGLLVMTTPAQAAPPNLDVYSGTVASEDLGEIAELGIDRRELSLVPVEGGKGLVQVETILSAQQAADLQADGIELRKQGGSGGGAKPEVFRKYSGNKGLKKDFTKTANQNPDITKLVSIGQTVQGEDIVALKVSEDATTTADGDKPAVLYIGAQHAREWITPEMIRRLKDEIIKRYNNGHAGTEALLEENELWFIPVANPDGYDFTFEKGQRLWRKNLRDNNNDGEITAGDGVDLNRNFDYRWGYDNEGSSPQTTSETYRGPGPNSEPETQALDQFVGDIGFEFFVNYHSAAELLLYGIGWQVATPSPDDVLYEAMAGNDKNPAVEGFDPDISAELYTTNGDTDTYMQETYGVLGFTPEMSTCETVSDSNKNDEWKAKDCGSGFEFPDDEKLIQKEFKRNLPFALSVAKSASDPDDPKSVVGKEAQNFRVDSFDVSYGDPQTVAAVAKRALNGVELNYSINGGAVQQVGTDEWAGGERYGNEANDYYAEVRGVVTGASEGDSVEVFFTGVEDPARGGDLVESKHFTYTVESSTGDEVLVIANEDYEGVNPNYPASVTAPKYATAHVDALEAAGYSTDVWDVDAQGVPHDLGVLSHYDAVVWYLGDNRLTQDPEDRLIQTPDGNLPDIAVAERQQYLTISVRDYLNEGGKLVHAGETAQYSGLPGISDIVGGLYYGLNGDPEAECVISSGDGYFEDCLILADDFRQYYLGAYARTSFENPEGVAGTDDPLTGYEGDFGGPVTSGDNPLDEAGAFQVTSDVLPPAEFPQFASRGAAEYPLAGGPYAPTEGTRYAGVAHADSSFTRLTRTIDLSSVAAADDPRLEFKISTNIESDYDFVIVEAHTPGENDWTTLRDLEGGTSTDVPADCEQGFLFDDHPFLKRYLTPGNPCENTGTTGEWNAFTGDNGGWTQAAVDLSDYAGQEVEISISYVTDSAFGGIGAFVDDTRAVAGGSELFADGFESLTPTWTVTDPPASSPTPATEWEFGEQVVEFFAATSTEDTLLLGFGLEQLATDQERVDLLDQALGGLVD